MTTEEDLRNGCAIAYRKADAILRGEPRDSNGLNRDQIAAVRSLHSIVAASVLSLLRSNAAPVLVLLVFDLDCMPCGCVQVNFYTQVLCHSYPTDH